MLISVVVPCYNEELTVDKFYRTILPVLKGLELDYEIIFVNDGSKDGTIDRLKQIANQDKKVKAVSFSKNFGQQAAIFCGLKLSQGDCVLPIDCDLQDPVEVIPQMVDLWRNGVKVVHGRRRSRKGESAFKKITAKTYYKFLNKITNNAIPINTGDFKLLDRQVVDVITNLPEHNKYLRGLESWVGFKSDFVDFDRQERFAGKTNYTLSKMLKLSSDGIFSNSDFPLKLFLKLGIGLTCISILSLIAFIFLQIFVNGFNPIWWILGAVGLIGGLLLTSKGISDIYLYRIYEEVKNRPQYIIEEKINF